jgi:hypothetical protein
MAMRPLRPLGRLNAKSSCCVVRKPELVRGWGGVFVVAGALPGKENATDDKTDDEGADERSDAGRSGIGFERCV